MIIHKTHLVTNIMFKSSLKLFNLVCKGLTSPSSVTSFLTMCPDTWDSSSWVCLKWEHPVRWELVQDDFSCWRLFIYNESSFDLIDSEKDHNLTSIIAGIGWNIFCLIPEVCYPADQVVGAVSECDEGVLTEQDRLCPHGRLGELGKDYPRHASLQ